MFNFTIALIIFALFVLIKSPKLVTTRYLFCGVLGWSISLIGLINYMGKLNISYILLKYYFYVPFGIWDKLIYSGMNIILTIRMMNWGIIIFIISTYLFLLSIGSYQKKRKILFLPIAVLLIEPILYDPYLYRYLYMFLIRTTTAGYDQFQMFYDGFHIFTRMFNIMTLVIPTLFLGKWLFEKRHIPIIKSYYLLNTSSIIILILFYIYVYSWSPAILTNIYQRSTYLVYQEPDFLKNKFAYAIYPYFSLFSFFTILLTILKYKSVEKILDSKVTKSSRILTGNNSGLRVINHALKNQLLAIQFEAEEILDEIQNPLVLRNITSILALTRNSIIHLNELHSRISYRQIVMELINLSDLLLEFEKTLKTQLPESVELILHTSRDIRVFADKAFLLEIFNILIKNSLEAFSDENGEITVSIKLVGIWAVISISDNGPGIPEDILKQVSEPFFTTKSNSNNWGIGLSFVKGIIKNHHGDVSITAFQAKGPLWKYCFRM